MSDGYIHIYNVTKRVLVRSCISNVVIHIEIAPLFQQFSLSLLTADLFYS